jgi:type III restriction enzyme
MAKKSKNKHQIDAFNISETLKTAPCVPAIRRAVEQWREEGYKGVTRTTSELLTHWFKTDHRLPNGSSFRYHNAQREAIETLIYIYEIAKVRNRKDLLELYARVGGNELRLPPRDEFARYCIKMATGSGKTKLMSLAIVWQYANAVRENADDFAKTFLVLAPNVIVYERLEEDFANGKIFRTDPLIPDHYKWWWEMNYYMRGDTESAVSEGALYLTNIQQLYERADTQEKKETDIMSAMLGNMAVTKKVEAADFDERIIARDGLVMVLNDEAHHTHDEYSEWNNCIYRLHEKRKLCLQLDVSATPRYDNGSLFAWTVFDYPLKQAIIDRIVKRPIKGISDAEEAKSEIVTVKYLPFLTAGVERWKEYVTQLSPLEKKPLLFIMMNSTKEADDVAAWLQERYPQFFGGDKTLTIHTDRKGDISSNKDLDKYRKASREVDLGTSPVNAIVSVLMLREGWDVKNVTVIVGLRPYSSVANILPEQTIGRGLRLMFRDNNSNFQEHVDVIGNKHFIQFLDDLEQLEDIKFESYRIGKDKLKIVTIVPVLPEKAAMDIGLPEITPLLMRKKNISEEIQNIDVQSFANNNLPYKQGQQDVKTFMYQGRDILTDEKLFEKQYEIPIAQTPEEVIGYYARVIAQEIKLPSHFKDIAPKVKQFFEHKAFGASIDLYQSHVIKAMSSKLAAYVVVQEFVKRLRTLVVEEKQPELLQTARFLSETPPFPTSRKLLESNKTVFNLVACDNDFELAFAQFLDNSIDVVSFSKLPEQFGFCIQYTDTLANVRNYYPDFVARTIGNEYWLIETKGREDVDVKMKDNAAKNWCEVASELTGASWNYVKVLQKEFEKLQPDEFSDLQVLSNAATIGLFD